MFLFGFGLEWIYGFSCDLCMLRNEVLGLFAGKLNARANEKR